MSQTSKIILVAITAALVGGGGVYLWQSSEAQGSPPVATQEDVNEPSIATETSATNEWDELIKNNCELSGGSFSNNRCVCESEEEFRSINKYNCENADSCLLEEEIQELAYNKNTGYCQTMHGGAGGEAFFAESGAPYGYYSFWREIVFNHCEATGGSLSGLACICPENTFYDKSDGQCKSK